MAAIGALPAPADTMLEVASAHYEAGRLLPAEDACRQALRARPDDPAALHLLGCITHRVGRPAIAIALFRKAIALDPDVMAVHYGLGVVHMGCGEMKAAQDCFRRALALAPAATKAHINLGRALLADGQLAEAEASLRRALALEPDNAYAYLYLGATLVAQGLREEAIACYRQALALDPDFRDAHGNILFASHYLPAGDRATLLAEARAWGERFAAPLAAEARPHTNVPDPERRLRVGYLSADFFSHPVGHAMQVVLPEHDKAQVEVFCYMGVPRVDDVTRRIRAAADHWRVIWGLDDQTVADLIRQDGIDILVDLSGHTQWNRLLVAARKPAPVQAIWLGYFDTTGVRSIDYLLGDGIVCPEGDERWYVERIARLPETFLCYAPRDRDAPLVPPPALARGYVTFGCCNNIAKVTPEVVALWAAILRALPAARICLKTAALDTPGVRERYAALFAAGGVAPERVTLDRGGDYADYLAGYGEIDIALDPFPYNGGATSVEALWMGVPLITLRGERFVGRMGASILTAAGLDEFIAESPDDYVAKAVALASDLPRLAALRAGMRQRLERSPVCDGARFARGLEATYRAMWREWCRTQPAPVVAAAALAEDGR